jgi:MFS family permease
MTAPQHDPYAALRFRNYRLAFAGYVLASMGYQMQNVAIGWELYERTNSALILGGIGLVQVIPVILLTLPAGHAADRFDRRQVIIWTQVMLALCSVGLAVLSYHQESIALIYTCLLLVGVARAFNQPASDALLPQLVPLSVFGNAATWNSSAFQLASVIGPAVGGVLLAVQNRAAEVYLVDAALSMMRVLLVALIVVQPIVRVVHTVTLKSLLGGVRFVRQNQVIWGAIALDMFAVLMGGAVALLPIFARDILHVGPTELGWLRTAPSVGAIAMAILLAYLPPLQHAGQALLWSVAGFGLVTIAFGLSQSLWLSLVTLALSGALDNISVVIRHALVQIRTPDELRGRVSAVNSVFIGISNELGAFESGLAAALLGPVFAVVTGGIGTIISVIVIAAVAPEIRKLRALDEQLVLDSPPHE